MDLEGKKNGRGEPCKSLASTEHDENTPVRIITSCNGYLHLNEDALRKICCQVKAVKPNKESVTCAANSSLVILSVVGDRNSGKSFLLNLLLQYLRSNGDGNWMNTFKSQGITAPGFNVKNLFPTPKHPIIERGIYAWPQLLSYQDENSCQTLSILLLDAETDNDADLNAIEKFCSMLSSVLIDNRTQTFKRHLLQNIRDLASINADECMARITYHEVGLFPDQIFSKVCKRIHFVIRDFENHPYPCGKENKACEFIQNAVETTCHPYLRYFFRNLENVGCFLVTPPDQGKIGLDSNGKLVLSSGLETQLKTMCGKIMGSIVVKEMPDGLTLEEFMRVCVAVVNRFDVKEKQTSSLGSPSSTILTSSKDQGMDCAGAILSSGMIPFFLPPDDEEMADVSTLPDGCAVPQHHLRLSKSPGGHCPLTKSKVSEDLINDAVNYNANQVTTSFTVQSSEFVVESKVSEEAINNEECKSDSHQIRTTVNTVPSSPKSDPTQTGASKINGNNIVCSGSKSSDEGRDDLESNSNTNPKSAYFTAPQSPSFSPLKVDSTPTNPSKLPPKLLPPQERDAAIMPQIEELKNIYKAALNKASDRDIYSVHKEQSKKTTLELRRFLNDHIDSPQKKKEFVEQMEKWLKIEFQKIEKGRKSKNKPNQKVKDSPSTINENSISISSTNRVTDYSDSKSKVEAVAETSEVMETNLDESPPPLVNGQTNQLNPDEPMDTLAPPDSDVFIGPQPEPSWIKGVISTYSAELHKSVNARFQKKLTLSNDDFQSAQKESLKAVNKQLSQILNKYNWPVKKNGVPSELQDEKGQPNANKFLMNLEINAESEKMENENSQRRFHFEKFNQQYQDQLGSKLQAWIRQFTNLKIKLPDKGEVFLNRNLKEVNLYHIDIERSLMDAAIRNTETFKIYKQAFSHIEKCLDLYRNEMEKKFETNRAFSDRKFEIIEQSVYDSSTDKFNCEDANSRELIIHGLYHLKGQFVQRNKFIQGNEMNASERLFPSLETFYREMMTECTKGKFFMTDKLIELHKMVVEETIAVFWKSCDFKSNQEIPKCTTSKLEQQLEQQFKKFENDNKIKAEKIRTEIRILLANHRKFYNERMDKILPSRGPSQDEKELNKKHIENLKEFCKLLEMAIRDMEVKIPFEEHVATLKSNIEQDWIELQKLNDRLKQKDDENAKKKLEEESRRQRELEKEAKKREAVAVLEETKTKRTEEKNIRLSQASSRSSFTSSLSISSSAFETTQPAATTIPQKIVLPPIAIEFSLTLVRVGWMNNGSFEIINNPWGKEKTPTFITVKEDGEIKIGIETKEEPEKTFLQDVVTHHNTQEFECFVDGKIKTLRSEVLVALFLARLKSDVELQLRGQWTMVTISVPLFFNSVQRQAMKDSASLAGFQSIQLINDTTAAAFCYTKIENHVNFDNMLLVGVAQNHGTYFDAALYEWNNSKTTGLELISNATCGNLHSSGQVNNGLVSKLTGAIKKQITKWWSGEQVDSIRDMIKVLVGAHKEKTTASLCVSYKVDDTFDHLINHYGRPVPSEKAQRYIIMGAAMYSNDSFNNFDAGKKISIKDRASYMFERTKHRVGSVAMATIFKYQQLLSASKVQDEHTISVFSGYDIRIPVRGASLGEVHHVGHLVLKPNDDASGATEARVKFALSNEGIFGVERVYTSIQNIKTDLNFEWESPNLKLCHLPELKGLVQRMIKDEKKEAFEKAKNDLQALVEDIQPHIKDVKSLIGKTSLENAASGTTTLLTHANTTVEQINSRIELLRGLKDKYCPQNL